MRANVAPMLAEFGDDAGARNILLDRFRDDCIRGAGGETEIVDWSEAQVRELLSLSQQEATQYEIPLLNVNGEPYFPRRAVRLPLDRAHTHRILDGPVRHRMALRIRPGE